MKRKAEAQALKVLYDLPAWTGADGKHHQPFKAYLDSPKRKDKMAMMKRWLATADSSSEGGGGEGEGEKRAKKIDRYVCECMSLIKFLYRLRLPILHLIS